MLQPEFIIGSSKRSFPLHYSRKLPVPQVTKRAGRDTAVHSNVYRRQKPCKRLCIRIPQKSILEKAQRHPPWPRNCPRQAAPCCSDRMGRRPGTVRPGPNRDRPQSGQEAWRARIFGGRFFRPDAYTALWRGVFRLAGLVDMGQSQFAQGVLVVEAGISGVQNVHHVELCQTGGHGPIAEK